MHDPISNEHIAQARHMTTALLGSMTPYQIAKEIGVMYQTVLKIAHAETAWISMHTYEALIALHKRWRNDKHRLDRHDVEPHHATSMSLDSDLEAGKFSPAARGMIDVPRMIATIARLEKRLVILQRMKDLAGQL